MASIVDKPKESTEGDLLEIEKYTNGLIKFIETSATPITIGIQGEWGSGKTSLLNTIKEDLCDKDGAQHYPVWLNTWEYSLLSTPDETLAKIILGLVQQIGDLTKSKNSENGKKVIAAAGSLMKGFGSVMGGFSGKAIEMAGDVMTSSTTDSFSENSIRELRGALQNVIDDAIKNSSGSKRAFIFFIDDLDRLDPAVAVNILELIKNLFDLRKCIFVLAIDYGVVVKGLQSKFGKMTDENEWEFRAFFDKIIQLPFSMPISNYNVEKYLQNLLVNVNYFSETDLQKQEILSNISEIVGLSVGTNPRALKRLANSVALIEIIRGDEQISVEERVIEFALICIQIAYPFIYGLIQKESDFTSWHEQLVYTVLKNKKIDVHDLDVLKETEEFDEEWEQNLWKVCQINTFLKQRTYQLSKLLNLIKDNIPDQEQPISVTLDRLLSMSSVTSVSAESVVKSSKDNFQFKSYNQEFFNNLSEQYKEFTDSIKSKFTLSSDNNGGSIYFKYALANLEFNFVFWRDSKQIAIGLDALKDTNVISKQTARDWFQKYMQDVFPSMKYSGKKRWGFLNLYHYTFTQDEMSLSEEEKNEIYQKKVLEIMDKLSLLKDFYIKSQNTVSKVHGLLDKIEEELQIAFSKQDNWHIKMNGIKELKQFQSITLTNSEWGGGNYKVYLSSQGSYFRDPYIGISSHKDFERADKYQQEALYKKLENRFQSLGSTSQSFFRAKIEIDSPVKKIDDLDVYAYSLEEEDESVKTIIETLKQLASFKDDFSELAKTGQ